MDGMAPVKGSAILRQLNKGNFVIKTMGSFITQ